MSMTLIQGKFRVIKAAPDGDSIRFYPNDPSLWQKISPRIRTNATGGAQLRLDAIDALETHFQAKGGLGTQHQPLKFADAASEELLKFLGFTDITRNKNQVVSDSTPEEVPGFIVAKYADVYGRSVSFIFKGEATQADGADIFIDPALLKKSANYHMLSKGLAYPTFYSKLYPDLRQEMIKAVEKARKANKGVWSLDKTNQGFVLESLATITDDVVILPKLFRRLLAYLAINDGSASLDGFPSYLKSLDDRIIILPDGHVTGFHYAIAYEGQSLKMKYPPENVIFVEK
jgi:endonuclease YncB( thermonuclease family)